MLTATEPRQAVHDAYQWAWQVGQQSRASMMLMFCAANVRRIVESDGEQYPQIYEALVAELGEWRKRAKVQTSDELRKAIEAVAFILQV